MRAFLALELPEEVLDALDDVQDRIPVGRLTDMEALHLTLVFLDEITGDQAETLHDVLEGIRITPFDLQLRGLGTFGARSPRSLWAGVAPSEPLAALQSRLKGAAHLAGIALPRRRFRPHVTLARFPPRLASDELERLRRFLDRFAGQTFPAMRVEGFTLFRSHLGKGGAVHEALAEYPLTG